MTLASQVEVVLEPLRVDPAAPAPVTLRIPSSYLPAESARRIEACRSRWSCSGATSSTIRRASDSSGHSSASGALPSRARSLGRVDQLLPHRVHLPRVPAAVHGGRGGLLRTEAGLLVLVGATCFAAKLLLLFTGSLPSSAVGDRALVGGPLLRPRDGDGRRARRSRSSAPRSCISRCRWSSSTWRPRLGVVIFFHDRKHATHMLVAGTAAGLFAALVLISVAMSVGNEIDVIGDLAQLNDSVLLSTIAGGMLSGRLGRAASAARDGRARRRHARPPAGAHRRRPPSSPQDGARRARLVAARARDGQPGRRRGRGDRRDALLTRVGAYYHDLGKTIQPKYFVENLVAGEPTPHGDLEPDVSADAIMAHVVEGARILREGGIPEPVVEFAYTHHGTSVIEYFWHKCLEDGNPKGLSDAAFRYPGMRPRTKETAILMLIDAIEAAARTVDEPSREKFEASCSA